MSDSEAPGAGHNGPDFELARNIILQDIESLRDDSHKTNGNLSAAWKRVEKEAGAHKGAAKVVFSLLGKSAEHQTDFLRTFVGLARVFNLTAQVDLVDLAQGGAGFVAQDSLPTTGDDE